MIHFLLGVFLAALLVWADPPWEPKAFGIFMLAHGGSKEWNDEVSGVRKDIRDLVDALG